MAARHDEIGGLNATRARAFAATPDVLKCHQRSVAIAAHAGVAAAPVCRATPRVTRHEQPTAGPVGRAQHVQLESVVSSQVVIVGGGVIGSSIAYFLRATDPTVSVTVIERDPTYARSSSALSAASIRQQFSTPLSIEMSLFGIDFLRTIGERLEVDGHQPSIDLHEGGYLFSRRRPATRRCARTTRCRRASARTSG